MLFLKSLSLEIDHSTDIVQGKEKIPYNLASLLPQELSRVVDDKFDHLLPIRQ